MRIASAHGRAGWTAAALAEIARLLGGLMTTAEQLTPLERWYRIVSHALRHFLKGRAETAATADKRRRLMQLRVEIRSSQRPTTSPNCRI